MTDYRNYYYFYYVRYEGDNPSKSDRIEARSAQQAAELFYKSQNYPEAICVIVKSSDGTEALYEVKQYIKYVATWQKVISTPKD